MVTKIAHHTAEYANVPTLTGFLSQPQSTQPEPNKYIAIPCFSVPGKGLPFPPPPLPLRVPGPLLRLKTRCMRICDTRIVQHRGQSLSLARACLAGNRMRSKATHHPSLCSCSWTVNTYGRYSVCVRNILSLAGIRASNTGKIVRLFFSFFAFRLPLLFAANFQRYAWARRCIPGSGRDEWSLLFIFFCFAVECGRALPSARRTRGLAGTFFQFQQSIFSRACAANRVCRVVKSGTHTHTGIWWCRSQRQRPYRDPRYVQTTKRKRKAKQTEAIGCCSPSVVALACAPLHRLGSGYACVL